MLEALVGVAAAIAELVLWLKGPHHEPPREDMRVLGDIDPRSRA